MFAVFGALALLCEAVGLDLSWSPPWVQAVSNLGWLTAGDGLRHVSQMVIRG